MSKKILVGIVGCGWVADDHINSLLKINNVEIKWLCDISKDALKNSINKYNITNGTNEYRQIISDSTVDALIISTPPSQHFTIAKDAINAGKHVLIEKPISSRLSEAHKLYNLSLRHPHLVILDGSARHSRLQPKYEYVRNIIRSGKLGKVYCIHHNAVYRKSRPGIEYHPQSKWSCSKKSSGGGPLIDWGVYDLTFHLGILDDIFNPLKISSFTINRLDTQSYQNYDVEEHGIVVMRSEDNFIYYWERASNAHNEVPNQTRIYGTKGGLKFSYLSWESNKVSFYFIDSNNHPRKNILYVDMHGHISASDDFFALDKHFVNCILGKETPIVPLSASVRYLEIIFKSLKNQGSP